VAVGKEAGAGALDAIALARVSEDAHVVPPLDQGPRDPELRRDVSASVPDRDERAHARLGEPGPIGFLGRHQPSRR
jgi:hypothetical protein